MLWKDSVRNAPMRGVVVVLVVAVVAVGRTTMRVTVSVVMIYLTVTEQSENGKSSNTR